MEYDPETHSYGILPRTTGLLQHLRKRKKALENAKKAIALYLEPTPVELSPDEKVFEVEVPV